MPTWTTISRVRPGDQIAFKAFGVPAERWEGVGSGARTWRTVAFTAKDGRTRILEFEDGSTFEAGHAYRLWVHTPDE